LLKSGKAMLASGVDHLVYASASLERGMDEIEQLLGIRPIAGGHHPRFGTHNALLSLGSSTYLEIIARNPELPLPERGSLVYLTDNENSRLITWVFRPMNIQHSSDAASKAGIGLGPIETGSREAPDGSLVSWQLTDPYAMPMNGAIPFLIHWGTTAHPSAVAPAGGELTELIIEHPQAESVKRAVNVLGAEVKVVSGDEFRLSATIKTTTGLVALR
jgi:hypothetical protein